jgi:hypothetical protein
LLRGEGRGGGREVGNEVRGRGEKGKEEEVDVIDEEEKKKEHKSFTCASRYTGAPCSLIPFASISSGPRFRCPGM